MVRFDANSIKFLLEWISGRCYVRFFFPDTNRFWANETLTSSNFYNSSISLVTRLPLSPFTYSHQTWIPRRFPPSCPLLAARRHVARLLNGAWGALRAADAENGWGIGIIHSYSTGDPECLEEIVGVTPADCHRKMSISKKSLQEPWCHCDDQWINDPFFGRDIGRREVRTPFCLKRWHIVWPYSRDIKVHQIHILRCDYHGR